jgi:hypothetical protein
LVLRRLLRRAAPADFLRVAFLRVLVRRGVDRLRVFFFAGFFRSFAMLCSALPVNDPFNSNTKQGAGQGQRAKIYNSPGILLLW